MARKKFCKLISEAVKDEKQARTFYRKLKKSAGKNMKVSPRKIRKVVDSIMRQENKHASSLKRIKRAVCDKQ